MFFSWLKKQHPDFIVNESWLTARIPFFMNPKPMPKIDPSKIKAAPGTDLNMLLSIRPTKFITHGTEAEIYETNNPAIIIRIHKYPYDDSCEKVMMRPNIQNTGGVAKIYGEAELDDSYITFKEKVETNWKNYFLKKYGKDQGSEIIEAVLGLIHNFFWQPQFLKTIDECKNFISAIENGVPTSDIWPSNLGLNKDNHLVFIDC